VIRLKLSKNKQKFVIGIFIAILCSSSATASYFICDFLNPDFAFPLSPFEWDFSSTVKLSVQMEERSKHLLSVSVFTGTIDEIRIDGKYVAISTAPVYLFNDTFCAFRTWYNILDGEWYLDYQEKGIGTSLPIIIQPNNLTSLHIALSKDISAMYNITEGSFNNLDYIEIGTFHYWIWHIYEDGTNIIFDLYDNIVSIHYSIIREYQSTDHTFGVAKGSLRKNRWEYMCYTDEIMQNYTLAASEYLMSLYLQQ